VTNQRAAGIRAKLYRFVPGFVVVPLCFHSFVIR
jgi:hypothetical protein